MSATTQFHPAGTLTLLARKSQQHSDGLHLSGHRFMHTVRWPSLQTTNGKPYGPLVDGNRVLERSRGLHSRETAHVILVGDVADFDFDLLPGGSWDSNGGLAFEDIVSGCTIRQSRHAAFKDSWSRQLLNLSYLFDSGVGDDAILGARNAHFVDFDAQTVRIGHKFVSDVRIQSLGRGSLFNDGP